MIFSVQLQILPAALLESPLSYILPVITLSIPSIAFLSKLMLESMNDIEKTLYFRNAKLNNKGNNVTSNLITYQMSADK